MLHYFISFCSLSSLLKGFIFFNSKSSYLIVMISLVRFLKQIYSYNKSIPLDKKHTGTILCVFFILYLNLIYSRSIKRLLSFFYKYSSTSSYFGFGFVNKLMVQPIINPTKAGNNQPMPLSKNGKYVL